MSEFIDGDGVVSKYADVRGVVRGAYDGTRVQAGRKEYGPSLTVLSDAPEADLNVIVARWRKTGKLPDVKPLAYGDVSEAGSYVDVVERLKRVSDEFMKLRPDIRAFFGNDAAVFADWVSDPANVEEGRAIGLYAPEEPAGSEGVVQVEPEVTPA